jgi:hypothetical protein
VSRGAQLTPAQLADLLNFVLGGRRLHRLIVETWTRKGARARAEHWGEEVLRQCGMLPAPAVRRFMDGRQLLWCEHCQELRRAHAA